MLTLKNDIKGSRKIAKIKGGQHNGKFIYILEIPLDEHADTKPQEIKITDGKLQPLPNKTVVEKIYVTAKSNAGKSTFVGKWLGEALKMFKDDELYIFSPINSDVELDKYGPIRIALDMDLLIDPIGAEELENSIVVFDDTDTVRNPHLRMALSDFRDELLETGRHFNIRLLITSHVMMNYKLTRRILNEATAVCFFPKCGNIYHIKRYLTKYVGLEKNQIKKIMRLPSRWICIYLTYPMYILHERGAFIVSVDDENI